MRGSAIDTTLQDTDVILLDEPTTYLDMTHQIEVLDLLFELNEQKGRTIIMVLHDLNLASRYAHNIVAIKDGGVYAQGRPGEYYHLRPRPRGVRHGMPSVDGSPFRDTTLCSIWSWTLRRSKK